MPAQPLAADRYAAALYELATAEDLVTTIGRDLASVGLLWQEVPELADALAHPGIPREVKEGLLQRTLDEAVHPYVINALRMLIRRGRAGALPGMRDAFLSAAEDAGRLVRVVLRLAQPTRTGDIERYRGLVQETLRREIVLEVERDSSLLAGAELVVGGRRLDASLRGRLERLNEQLKG